MRRAVLTLLLAPAWAVLTILALPALGWTADTGAAAGEAVVTAGVAGIDTAQAWLSFFKANLTDIFSILGILITGAVGLALLIRAQVKLWRADAAGNALTSAVTLSGAEGAVRRVMDAAPAPVKAKVWTWVCKTFKFPIPK